ncbi:PIN domain-containing protein [Paramicrobacterium chengjingii]|uniref:PIN domain-containing protein n=1 Tax=Paramicrobacterium chengjingii TaxID=2769067 RepID=UPI003D9C7A86
MVYHEAKKLVARGTPEYEAESAAQRLIDHMSRAFDDSLVTGWEPPEGAFGLPDPDDEHVVATAVMGSAEVIVTENLRHFPATTLRTATAKLLSIAPGLRDALQ